MIQAIETVYNNYRFRSRLEARWAVYFHAMGWDFEYEKEGYDLGGAFYLPDFWLPLVSMWAEVKPDRFSAMELEKCRLLTQGTKFPCLMLSGLPQARAYPAWTWIEHPIYGSEDDPFEVIGQRPETLEIVEYVVSNLKGYAQRERRFYCNPSELPWHWEGMQGAIDAARQVRFEHGEHGRRAR